MIDGRRKPRDDRRHDPFRAPRAATVGAEILQVLHLTEQSQASDDVPRCRGQAPAK
jgi:hypothetical protein